MNEEAACLPYGRVKIVMVVLPFPQETYSTINFRSLRTAHDRQAWTHALQGYHILALVLFSPALVKEPQLLAVSLAIACALLIIVEAIRVSHVPYLGSWIHSFMTSFIDERDSGLLLVRLMFKALCIPPFFPDRMPCSGTGLHSFNLQGPQNNHWQPDTYQEILYWRVSAVSIRITIIVDSKYSHSLYLMACLHLASATRLTKAANFSLISWLLMWGAFCPGQPFFPACRHGCSCVVVHCCRHAIQLWENICCLLWNCDFGNCRLSSFSFGKKIRSSFASWDKEDGWGHPRWHNLQHPCLVLAVPVSWEWADVLWFCACIICFLHTRSCYNTAWQYLSAPPPFGLHALVCLLRLSANLICQRHETNFPCLVIGMRKGIFAL